MDFSGNIFGKNFKVTTWGESHGTALGAVIDGCPPGMEMNEQIIQKELEKRRPGKTEFASKRNEPDKVEILSGVFNGKTTGAPISLMVQNKDVDSSKYEKIKDMFRPGHADYTYFHRYKGFNDYRGSGRASGRETVSRVAAGAVAKKILEKKGTEFFSHVKKIGNTESKKIDEKFADENQLKCADKDAYHGMEKIVKEKISEGNSVGGIVEVIIKNPPKFLGNPVFRKLDAELAKAMLSIPGVKGIEFGEGFGFSGMTGKEANDEMTKKGFSTNHAGGIQGGISTGEQIVFRIAVKPTPSISIPQKTVDSNGRETEIEFAGRHDPCIAPRACIVAEAMAAIVLADFLLKNE